MCKVYSPRHFLKYCVVTLGFAQLGFFSPQAHAVLPVPTRPTSFPLSPVSYTTLGTVVGWGANPDNQATIPVGLSDVVQVSGGLYHSLALKSDGTVVGWGNDYLGAAAIPVGLGNVVQVDAGNIHSLALKSDGTVVGWGTDSAGQATIPVGLSNVVQVAAGGYHSLALKSDGTVVVWGYNGDGQTTIPVGLSNVVLVAAGDQHSFALKSDGTVVGWGYNSDDQATIPVGLSNVVQVSGGLYHSLALKSDGTVVAWGWNGSGQGSVPVGVSNVIQVAAGVGHNLALIYSSLSSQTITSFTTIPTKMYGSAPFTVTAPTANSGLPVTLSVVSGPATILGNTVTLTGVGTVVLAADQPGNGSYSGATQVTTSFQVNMGSQSIAKFSNIPDKKKNTPFAVTAPRATSGLPVTVRVRSGPATIANNLVKVTRPGIVVLEASQSGNSNYTAAVPVTCKFVVK